MRYLMTFSYDGTNFNGYQKQNGYRTVEEELENALFFINNHQETCVVSSGRTDKGVHALCQKAHFDMQSNISPEKLNCFNLEASFTKYFPDLGIFSPLTIL